jgi:hypothetical protein
MLGGMMVDFTTADVRRQIQDGSLSSGAIDGAMFDAWLREVKAAVWRASRAATNIDAMTRGYTRNPYDD